MPKTTRTKKSPQSKNEELEMMRHSFSHVLAMAVLRMFPEAKLGIGPAIEDGFYYDFDLPRQLTPEDLPTIEDHMRQIIEEDLPFQQTLIPRDEAIDMLNQQGQVYKVELIQEIEDPEISFFQTSDEFKDMCRGPHVKSTGELGAFKLTSIAGAYWKGDEKRPQLQRVYGVGFKNQKELEKYLERQEEMKKRDHRKLGPQLGLFMISEEIGAGLPIWLPNGYFIRRKLEDYMFELERSYGYEHVLGPHIAKVGVYETSGHWDFYKENMYSPMKIDNDEFVLNPMNCVKHIMIYKNKSRSYREFPMKIGEMGTVYRYEKSGELSGMMRVRGFTQNDAHIFCTEDQITEQFVEVLHMLQKLYEALGLKNYWYRVSLRDPNDKEKYAGDDKMWNRAENAIREALESEGLTYREAQGEAVFYGPKLDVQVVDCLGRDESASTIQIDFNLPERFKLEYIGEDGKEHQPVMIHRALIGSFERFFAFLIEHYGGAFPLWLSPVQIKIIPIADKHLTYAKEIKKALDKKNLRVETDTRQMTMQSKVRDAEMEKVPYMIVVGDKEQENKTISVRPRTGQDLGMMRIEEFIERATEEVENKK